MGNPLLLHVQTHRFSDCWTGPWMLECSTGDYLIVVKLHGLLYDWLVVNSDG